LPASIDLAIAVVAALVFMAVGSWFFAASSRRLALYL